MWLCLKDFLSVSTMITKGSGYNMTNISWFTSFPSGQMSVAQSLAVGDESALLDPDPELGDIKLPAIESWVAEAKAAFRADSTSSSVSYEGTSTDKQSSEVDANENVERDEFDYYDGNSLIEDSQLNNQGKLCRVEFILN